MRNQSRRGGFSNDRRRRNNQSFDREMFSAVCDECGRECEVPFKPSNDKPIYCSECFSERKPEGDSRDRRANRSFGGDRGGNRSFGRSSRRENKQMFGAICDECGQECEVPFRPTAGKPILCDNCFKPKQASRSQNSQSSNYQQEFANINAKLDYLIAALEKTPVSSVDEKIAVAKDEGTLPSKKAKKETTKKAKPAVKKSVAAKKTVTKKTTKKKTTTKKKK